jgi:pimeloyl-ACP methyl ester carboxylesterase
MTPTTFDVLEDGKRVRLARVGSGPPLVFLHGYPENLHIWDGVIAALANDYECLAFDWPGLGDSDSWPGGTTPVHLAERLLKLLDNWKIAKATIAGMDMGGQPALAFAAKYPERTAGLIVMNSLVLGDEKTSWEIALLRKYGFNRFILRHFPRLVFWRAEHTFLPAGVRLPPELRADFWRYFRRAEVREFLVRMCAGFQGTLPRLPESYSKIVAPTLILWADNDVHFPLAQGRRLQTLIPNSQLEIIPAAGHWMAWHNASVVAQHIRTFISTKH